MTRYACVRPILSWAVPVFIAAGCAASAPRTVASQEATASVRAELDSLYALNTRSFVARDIAGVMSIRHPEFHAITPDGTVRGYEEMKSYSQGIMNGITEWKKLEFTIDSLTVRGDTAVAIVRQHLDRMGLRPDQKVHHIQTWVTQRETWVRWRGAWRMWRVDQLRDQRRLIDGQPG